MKNLTKLFVIALTTFCCFSNQAFAEKYKNCVKGPDGPTGPAGPPGPVGRGAYGSWQTKGEKTIPQGQLLALDHEISTSGITRVKDDKNQFTQLRFDKKGTYLIHLGIMGQTDKTIFDLQLLDKDSGGNSLPWTSILKFVPSYHTTLVTCGLNASIIIKVVEDNAFLKIINLSGSSLVGHKDIKDSVSAFITILQVDQ